eukprot:Pompholyxophrys_punicea_v1_NODE_178_length_2994_cov_7.487581.p2 type:complete len:113 gc:universal NODE_178_length_2994_cov_7.487581:1542-1880(+)
MLKKLHGHFQEVTAKIASDLHGRLRYLRMAEFDESNNVSADAHISGTDVLHEFLFAQIQWQPHDAEERAEERFLLRAQVVQRRDNHTTCSQHACHILNTLVGKSSTSIFHFF